MLILAVLGSIFFGIATPTEAAGIGALGGFLLAVGNRKLSWQLFKESGYETTKMTGMIFGIFLGATAFSLVLRGLGGDDVVEKGLKALPFGPRRHRDRGAAPRVHPRLLPRLDRDHADRAAAGRRR